MKTPKRVLHVFGAMDRGGAETFIMNVFRRIDRSRIMFDFAVHRREPGHFDEEIRMLGGRLFVLPRPSLTSLFRYLREWDALLASEPGGFVAIHSHVHYFSGLPLSRAARATVPIRVSHSHNTRDGKGSTPWRWLYRWWMRHLIQHHATHLLACGRDASEAFFGERDRKSGRVKIVRNGIGLEEFGSHAAASKRAIREKHGLPVDGYVVGHVGRFDPQKNHAFLIEIFHALTRSSPDAYLMLIGDGSLRRATEKLVREKGLSERVFFMGVRTDVPELLQCLDVFVFPSRWEGFPVALLEAQAAGIPCVVSDRITREADAGLGLFRVVGLARSAEVWAAEVMAARGVEVPPWSTRRVKLWQEGYDAETAVETLSAIYFGE